MAKKNNKQQRVDTQELEFFSPEMHCGACELLVEKKLAKFPGVQKVDAVLGSKRVTVWGTFTQSKEELAGELSQLIEKDGYTISLEKEGKKKVNWGEFKKALPFAGVVIVLFVILQKLGILNTLSPESISLPAVFMIGVVASLSSCMAVVGGLALSISANYAKEESKTKRAKPMIMFHASRIIGFFFLGGLLGYLGTAFSIIHVVAGLVGLLVAAITMGLIKSENAYAKIGGSILIGITTYYLLLTTFNETWARFTLSFITGMVMVILALNLLDIFDFTKKLQFKMPKSISKKAIDADTIGNRFAPLLLGVATFFLPCGFTQSMQFQALGSQSFIRGALMMMVFALGNFPVLAGLSFMSNNLVDSKRTSGVFFKTAGIIVLFFSLINITGALVVLGVINPIFNF